MVIMLPRTAINLRLKNLNLSMKDMLVIQNQGYPKSMEFGKNLRPLKMATVFGRDNGLLTRVMRPQILRKYIVREWLSYASLE